MNAQWQWFCEADSVNIKTNSQRPTNGKNCLAVDVSKSIFRKLHVNPWSLLSLTGRSQLPEADLTTQLLDISFELVNPLCRASQSALQFSCDWTKFRCLVLANNYLIVITSLFLLLFLKIVQLLTAGHTFLWCNFIAICTQPITQENIGDTVVEGEFSINWTIELFLTNLNRMMEAKAANDEYFAMPKNLA